MTIIYNKRRCRKYIFHFMVSMNRFVSRLLQWGFIQWMIDFVIEKAPFLIPGEKLFESNAWIAINHPRPCYPVHIVILPRKPYRNWMSVNPTENEIFPQLIDISQMLIREFNLEQEGYRLILNGGKYQTFPHLHFHLISGSTISPVEDTHSSS